MNIIQLLINITMAILLSALITLFVRAVPVLRKGYENYFHGKNDSSRKYIELLKRPTTPRIELARSVYGIYPGDKVAVIIGSNIAGPESITKELFGESITQKKAVRDIALKSVGFGENLLLPELLFSLHSMGIMPNDMSFIYCQTTSNGFDPRQFIDTHLIFLGSINANNILRKYYWESLALKQKYQFRKGSIVINGKIKPEEEFKTNEIIPENALEKPGDVIIKDHFLLARTDNPYSNNVEKFKCILLSGTGTMGTGFAGLTIVSLETIKYIYESYKGNNFEMIGLAEIFGFNNNIPDSIKCVFDGEKRCDKLLLPDVLNTSYIYND